MPSPDLTLQQRLARRGVPRRDFFKFCTAVAGALALPKALAPQVAYALESAAQRPPVIRLAFQDCAGETESFLRASRPTAADVILDTIALSYHETVMAPSGKGAEKSLQDTIAAGGHVVMVEGSIPLKDGGMMGLVKNKPVVNLSGCSMNVVKRKGVHVHPNLREDLKRRV